MTETYRLVFRGEVLEGQHQAVVKQRLGEVLQLQGARLDALFTGKAVTVRKAADSDTAARFQVVFKRAGARLRVVPIEAQAEPEPTVPAATATAFNLAPPGALLRDSGNAPPPVLVDTSHLSLAAPGSTLSDLRPDVAVTVPDVSHLTVADPGEDLNTNTAEPDAAVVTVPAWGVAKVGADLAPPKVPIEPLLDLDEIDFDIAPPGARLADETNEQPPPPDTSHIHLK
jgi:hypothetical protein